MNLELIYNRRIDMHLEETHIDVQSVHLTISDQQALCESIIHITRENRY